MRAVPGLVAISLAMTAPAMAMESADMQLLARVRALAEGDGLFEPQQVAGILAVAPDFRAEVREMRRSACADSAAAKVVSARWTPPWAKHPSRVPSAAGVELPPEVENYAQSAPEAGSLQITYRWVRQGACTAAGENEEEARVVFDWLPAFTCVTADAVAAHFKDHSQEPQPPPRHGEPVPQVLLGPQSESRGSRITVDYWGNGCAQSIRIEQATRFGSRQQAAD